MMLTPEVKQLATSVNIATCSLYFFFQHGVLSNCRMEGDSSVAFTIDMTKPQSRPRTPARLLRYQREHSNVCKDQLELKQILAEQRRKAYEQAKIERIKERTEECTKIDAKVQSLLAQDAKRRGLPGTEDITPMSKKEVVSSIKTLNREFTKITMDLSKTDMPKS